MPAFCHNCDTPLQGHYCAHCGQADYPLDPGLHDLTHELTHEFLHLDGKILTTLKYLLFFPGRLSSDFLAGRRARHIGPVRLYLTMSVLFFLLLAHGTKPTVNNVQPAVPEIAASKSEKAAPQPGAQVSASVPVPTANAAAQEKKSRWALKIKAIVQKASSDPETFQHEILTNSSHAMFVLVPIFALLLQLAYRNRRHHYPAYVYFSLHIHAFVFLLFSLNLLVGLLKVDALDTLMFWLVLLGVPVYLYLAMRRVFGGSRKRTLLRLFMLGCTYSFCLLVGITTVFALTVCFLYF